MLYRGPRGHHIGDKEQARKRALPEVAMTCMGISRLGDASTTFADSSLVLNGSACGQVGMWAGLGLGLARSC